jgi:hypothetical protein
LQKIFEDASEIIDEEYEQERLFLKSDVNMKMLRNSEVKSGASPVMEKSEDFNIKLSSVSGLISADGVGEWVFD